MEYDRLGRERPSGIRQLARRALLAATPASRVASRVGAHWPIQWTFDDGPDPEQTPRVLEALAEHAVKAAFFLIGQHAERHPHLVRRIAQEGHRLGSHSYSHPAAGTLNGADYLADIERGRAVVETASGIPVPAFRPPHGYLSASIVWRLVPGDWQVVLWSVDPKDYMLDDPAVLARRLDDSAIEPGDIVLLHDTAAATATGLADYLGRQSPGNRP